MTVCDVTRRHVIAVVTILASRRPPRCRAALAIGLFAGVQPIGLTVLKHAGVLPQVLEHGARVDRLHAVTREGKDVLDLRCGVRRSEVCATLEARYTLSMRANTRIACNRGWRRARVLVGHP